jgi:hypothetical protein
MKEAPAIDPDDFMGGFGCILQMDTFGIYESRIWMLYKDVCGQDLTKMLTLLRGVQLGIISQSQLDAAIGDDNSYGDPSKLPMSFSKCLAEVQKIATNFAPTAVFVD